MGVHNGANRFEESIESILNQTYTNWEFIICDDGSSDNSYDILKEKYGRDNRFHIIKNMGNKGLAASLNHCLEFCNGDYIARMDDDDISYPDRFEKQIKFLDEHEKISFVSSSVDLFDGNTVVGTRKLVPFPTKKNLVWNSPFVHPATMFRKDDLLKAGKYRVSEETIRGQDYDLFMRMYGMGFKGANLSDPVYRFTVDDNNLKRRTLKARFGEITIRRKGYKEMGVMPWAYPFIFKPLVAHIVMGVRNKINRRGY